MLYIVKVLGPMFLGNVCEHPAGEPRALEMDKDRRTEYPLISRQDGKWAKRKGQEEEAD